MKLLLENGADPNESSEGTTPLVHAMGESDTISQQIVELLTEAGAKAEDPDDSVNDYMNSDSDDSLTDARIRQQAAKEDAEDARCDAATMARDAACDAKSAVNDAYGAILDAVLDADGDPTWVLEALEAWTKACCMDKETDEPDSKRQRVSDHEEDEEDDEEE